MIHIASATIPFLIKKQSSPIYCGTYISYTGDEEREEDQADEGDTTGESMESEEEFCDDEVVDLPAEEEKDSPQSII